MGKPVVSVSTPEIDKYADVVEIAHSRAEFLAKLDEVLSRPSAPAEIRRRVDRVAGESWDARMSAVLEIVRRHHGQKQLLEHVVPAVELQAAIREVQGS